MGQVFSEPPRWARKVGLLPTNSKAALMAGQYVASGLASCGAVLH